MSIKDPTPIEVTKADKQSPLWKKLLTHWENRLNALRIQNDGELDEIKTATLRGQIAAYKDLLALNKDPVVIEEHYIE